MLLNEKVGVATMDTTTTMGDRILTLMRRRGRDDRGREYEQRELVAMLNGDIVAPDGRFYNISTSATAISRLIGGDLTRPSLEILDAICSMFDSDMEWIVRGRTLE
ncbi:MAG TPA: hypothetical protein VLA24_14245, partial [Pseudomonadales bacterium]|nr:hypothetical protein [Pseudomonadales bacterium]